jgi:hypothetical protein
MGDGAVTSDGVPRSRDSCVRGRREQARSRHQCEALVVRAFAAALLALWVAIAVFEILRPPLGRTPLLSESTAARVCPPIEAASAPQRFEVTSGPAALARAGWPAIPGRIEHDSVPAAHGLVTPHGRVVWTSSWIAFLGEGTVSENDLPALRVVNRSLGVRQETVPLVVSDGLLLEQFSGSGLLRLVKLGRSLQAVVDRALGLATRQLFGESTARVALLATDADGGAFVLTKPLTVSHLGPDLKHAQEPLLLGELSPTGWRVDATAIAGVGQAPGVVCARLEATAMWRDGGHTGPFRSKPLIVAFDRELKPIAVDRVFPGLRWQILGAAAGIAALLGLVGLWRIRAWRRIAADFATTHCPAELLEARGGEVRLVLADGPLTLTPGSVPTFLCWPWAPWAGSRWGACTLVGFAGSGDEVGFDSYRHERRSAHHRELAIVRGGPEAARRALVARLRRWQIGIALGEAGLAVVAVAACSLC